MQNQSYFLLPKLKITNKIKTNSSHTNFNNCSGHSSNNNNNKNNNYKNSHPTRQSIVSDVKSIASNKNLQAIKQSRSKSSAFGNQLFKCKYVSKSPEYFKRKQRSVKTIDHYGPISENATVQQFIGCKIKQFNKHQFLQLTKQSLMKQYEGSKKQQWQHQQQSYHNLGVSQTLGQSKTLVKKKKTRQQLYDTKYSKFAPGKIAPISHSLHKMHMPYAIFPH